MPPRFGSRAIALLTLVLSLLLIASLFDGHRTYQTVRRSLGRAMPSSGGLSLAPLEGCDNALVIPGSYTVSLRPGVTLAQHEATLGNQVDLQSKVSRVFTRFPGYGDVYVAVDVDDTLLAAIRADPAVKFVDCENAGVSPDLYLVDVKDEPTLMILVGLGSA